MSWELGDDLEFEAPSEYCRGPYFYVHCTNCNRGWLVCKCCVIKGFEPSCKCDTGPEIDPNYKK